jgi:hypothetical protein
MKKIIYLIALIALVASSGCVIRGENRGGYHDVYQQRHEHGEGHWEHY